MSEFTNHAERALERLNETRVRGTEGATEKAKILWVACTLMGWSPENRSVFFSTEQIAEVAKIDLEDALSRVADLAEQGMMAVHTPNGARIPAGVFAAMVNGSEYAGFITEGGKRLQARQLLLALTNLGLDRALSECRWVEPLIREGLTTERPEDIDG